MSTENGRLAGNFYRLHALFALWLYLNMVLKFLMHSVANVDSVIRDYVQHNL